MSLAIVATHALIGLTAPGVSVEVHLANGLPGFSLVGLPQAEVRESRDRVRAALLESGYDFPNRRITVNLAPADLPKTGGWFDLPIALGILVANGVLEEKALRGCVCFGELSLAGALKPLSGAVALGLALGRDGVAAVLCPSSSVAEMSLAGELKILGAASLRDLVERLKAAEQAHASPVPEGHSADSIAEPVEVDFSHIRGQMLGKKAMEIAAAGGHSALLVGPPGSGKTMLAQAMTGLLPDLNLQEARESAAVHSLAGKFDLQQWRKRPWRAPHHSSSTAALIGGGAVARPGEISLAHNGVLFLDELPEFSRHTLDAMRQPLESGAVDIVRAAYRARFPANTQLLAAMNPCICGYFGTPRCRCTPDSIVRYQARVSGPLLDRIDLQLRVSSVDQSALLSPTRESETTMQVRQRVLKARECQLVRQGKINARLSSSETEQHCVVNDSGRALLSNAFMQFGWSARSLHRVLRVARTIADLEGVPPDSAPATLSAAQVAQAIQFRRGLLQEGQPRSMAA